MNQTIFGLSDVVGKNKIGGGLRAPAAETMRPPRRLQIKPELKPEHNGVAVFSAAGIQHILHVGLNKRKLVYLEFVVQLKNRLVRSRDDPLDDLRSLGFGIRIDQPGMLMRDYHTVHGTKDAYVTERYYMEDAVFLAGLEGDEALLNTVDEALSHPYYPLFLGRRSCPVTGKVSLGVRDVSLNEALNDEPWIASSWYVHRHPNIELEITMDSDGSDGYLVRDEPVSFSQKRRLYGFRKVVTSGISVATTSKTLPSLY